MAEGISATKKQGFLFDVSWGASLRILRTGLRINQSCLAIFLAGAFSAIENLSGEAKVAARPDDIAALCGVIQNAKFSAISCRACGDMKNLLD
jgi:hypothetical protein